MTLKFNGLFFAFHSYFGYNLLAEGGESWDKSAKKNTHTHFLKKTEKTDSNCSREIGGFTKEPPVQ